ncbi:Hemolysin, chromosomal [Pelagimonas phthalicica]|uniref:Hemolysin, chromosomal n=2 Tax=Pelagimonas phthalicica TaxID=1037362 RepID=A0A238J5N8_9RHOB|nr:hypothetical protein CLV87_2033 [Pelagimonas phthalicica]SMX25968.1 Hemolysin, chromosomal [Pelagimonas phthalicica]
MIFLSGSLNLSLTNLACRRFGGSKPVLWYRGLTMYLAFLGLAALGLLGSMVLGSSDDDDGAEDAITDDTPIIEEPGSEDLGATLTTNADGSVTVDLGEDETGSLVLFRYSDTEDAGVGLSESFSYELYLLPEDGSIPEFSYSGANNPRLDGSETLQELAEALDLQPVASWDLGDILPTNEEPYFIDNTVPAPVIQSDHPIAVYDVEANTDGDEIIYLRPEGYEPPPPTHLGAEQEDVFANTTGSEEPDWLVGQAAGIVIDGAGGDDRLESRYADTTLIGGDGDDDLYAYSDNTSVEGGAGDDRIDLISNGVAYGGEGEDYITYYGSETVVEIHGGEGNDRIYGSGPSGEIFGDAGDDFLGIANGVTGHGGEGNDHLQIRSGGVGDAGAGDDLITTYNFLNDEDGAATVTGGEGADTVRISVRNPYGEGEIEFMTITDFDPAEDILEVSSPAQTSYVLDDVAIVEAADGSYSDVLLNYAPRIGDSPETATAVVRLTGVSGMTADQIVVT